jgi:SAM-dependent methyltransferase
MHRFHNDIKRKYLDKYSKSPVKLLDLASGRGGDLKKWGDNKNIIQVDGYDINELSVAEAKERKKSLKIKKQIKFEVKDLSKDRLRCYNKFDLITSFFAFHYFFKNRKTINTIFGSIYNCSAPGTVIILTLFDGELIMTLPEEYSTNLFSINRISNKAISVKLNNSILEKTEIESIVTKQDLIDQFEKINFKLVESVPFYLIKSDKYKLTPEESVYSDLNVVYVFRKQLDPVYV